MVDDEPINESDSDSPEEPESLADTEADIGEFFGSEQPGGEKRIDLSEEGSTKSLED